VTKSTIKHSIPKIILSLFLLSGQVITQSVAQTVSPTGELTPLSLNPPAHKGSTVSSTHDVESLVKELRPDHSGLITPLLAQADIHLVNNEYQVAEQNYLECVLILENQAGVFDQALIPPLIRLGNLYQNQRRFQEALDMFQRAKHISHRNAGLYNLAQVPIVESISDIYLKLNSFKEAEREQWYRFYIFGHFFENSTAALLPAIFKLADWYRNLGEQRDEQYIYEETISTLEAATEQTNIDLITSLRTFATNYRLHGFADRQGRKALKRALAISEQDIENTSYQYAEILIDLGDWYIIAAKPETAQSFYEQMWQFLESKGKTKEELQALFKYPTALRNSQLNTHKPSRIRLRPNYAVQLFHGLALPQHFPNNTEDLENISQGNGAIPNSFGRIDVRLNVKKDGTVENVVLEDEELPPQFIEPVLRNLNALLFRPRLFDGKPVAAQQIKIRLTFIED